MKMLLAIVFAAVALSACSNKPNSAETARVKAVDARVAPYCSTKPLLITEGVDYYPHLCGAIINYDGDVLVLTGYHPQRGELLVVWADSRGTDFDQTFMPDPKRIRAVYAFGDPQATSLLTQWKAKHYTH